MMERSGHPGRLTCQACGASPDPDDLFPIRCPDAPIYNSNSAAADPRDHLLVRDRGVGGDIIINSDSHRVNFPQAPFDSNQPFVRYRHFLLAHGLALRHGLDDRGFIDLVLDLDACVCKVDGRGFAATPCVRASDLESQLVPEGELWIKDETANVTGTHKGRHLFAILLHLELETRLSSEANQTVRAVAPEAPLVIASCGNAALAAAVVAKAGDRELHVLVPADADPTVVEKIVRLGASVEVCPRIEGRVGDPCMHRLHESIEGGEVPFTVQGQVNGLSLEGGLTLGYELISTMVERGGVFDRVFVQVGGGALGSSLVLALQEAVSLGLIEHLPRIHAVQTSGAHPLERAYRLVQDQGLPPSEALDRAASNRRGFMWPWETTPKSRAHGILDDETYDWLPIARGMLESGGEPVVVTEDDLLEAESLANQPGVRDGSEPRVDATGAAGLAGLIRLKKEGEIRADESIAVLFTGAHRAANPPGADSGDA